MTIDKAVGPNAYRLRIPGHWRMHNVFNVSALKPWHDNGMKHPPPAWTLLQGQNYEFEVDHIIDHEIKSNDQPLTLALPLSRLKQFSFKVRWTFYGPDYDSWEPYLCLKNAPKALAQYCSPL